MAHCLYRIFDKFSKGDDKEEQEKYRIELGTENDSLSAIASFWRIRSYQVACDLADLHFQMHKEKAELKPFILSEAPIVRNEKQLARDNDMTILRENK